ncbi:Hypothetical predicted protein [Podarcis lilfordi]|uniref:Uncharacterized protein n=1 Tax=Podarcis lilfordi TaxID=74358 RepID=A0AA35KBP5_9SAUR|nr:Hypothetical predicted protein [Podarcis lilfordi]
MLATCISKQAEIVLLLSPPPFSETFFKIMDSHILRRITQGMPTMRERKWSNQHEALSRRHMPFCSETAKGFKVRLRGIVSFWEHFMKFAVVCCYIPIKLNRISLSSLQLHCT